MVVDNFGPAEPVAIAARGKRIVVWINIAWRRDVEIKRIDASVFAISVQEKTSTADTGKPGLYYTQDKRRRDCGIHGIATTTQDRSTRLSCEPVLAGDHAAFATDLLFLDCPALSHSSVQIYGFR
ncbi:hypothetical protein D9M69_537330 [compost metagenome]